MYNESGDRIWHLQHYGGEAGQSLTAGDNLLLTVKLDAAVTSGSIDSMKVTVSYYVYDNSKSNSITCYNSNRWIIYNGT